MTVDQVIQKVRQLRALSSSTNVHEAAVAAAAADKLMQQYRIEEAAIEFSERKADSPARDATPLASWKRRPTWARALLKGICDHFGVAYSYEMRRGGRGASTATAYAWGRRDDVALAREMFAFGCGEIDALVARMPGQGRSAINSFRIGAAHGIVRALRRSRLEAMAAAPKGAAIVLTGRLDQSMAAMLSSLGKIRHGDMPNGPSDLDAYARGVAAGENIDLSSGKRLEK